MSESATLPPTVLDALRDEIHEGLTRPHPELSPRFFYDHRGSELFERITRLPEYYPTRTETELLEAWAGPMIERLRPRALLELGAGSARKTRILLKAMEETVPGARYVPLDVSGDFLEATAVGLRRDFPHLEVVPEVADFTQAFRLSHPLPRPAIHAFLGGTIGNFTPGDALDLLGRITERMTLEDHLLLGVDLRPGEGKTKAELEAAYDDSDGVTALFNLNMLSVLNASAGTDFDADEWEHRAFYDESEHRIEMHLDAPEGATVRVPDRDPVTFAPGEGIRTEISSKYDRDSVDALFARCGLRRTDWLTDARARYALVLGVLA